MDEKMQTTEEIIQAITAAEERAAEIRKSAAEQAARILVEAENQAANSEKSSAEVCKAYAESQLKAARAEAEKCYTDRIEEQKRQSKEDCENILQNAENSVTEIVGRIVGGNR